jgi:hypothetical protein
MIIGCSLTNKNQVTPRTPGDNDARIIFNERAYRQYG